MELPYTGRATINEDIDKLQVTIPPKRYIVIVIFMCFWLFAWTLGGLTTFIAAAFNSDIPLPVYFIFPLFWCLPLIFIGRILWWLIFGKEIIEVGHGILHTQKKGLLFSKAKTYDLKECKAFRTVDNSVFNSFPFFGFGLLASLKSSNNGTLAFDYGMKTLKFADGIDEAEGKHILNALKDKGLLREENL